MNTLKSNEKFIGGVTEILLCFRKYKTEDGRKE